MSTASARTSSIDTTDRQPSNPQHTTWVTAVPGGSAGSMRVRYTVSNATPSQRRLVADQPATQWKSAVISRRGSYFIAAQHGDRSRSQMLQLAVDRLLSESWN